MTLELNAVLVTLGWCAVLYFILLVVTECARLFAVLRGLFQRGADEKYTRDYIDAMNRLADTRKKDGE